MTSFILEYSRFLCLVYQILPITSSKYFLVTDFSTKFPYETSIINIKFLCDFQNLRKMTNLIKTHLIISRNFLS